MIVHLPIEVAFDFGPCRDTLDRQTLTVRFDTETTDVPVEVTRDDPTNPKADWQPASAIVEMMTARAWNRLMDRIQFSPIDYCADSEEGERRQQLVYAQLGVGEAA